MDPKTQQPRVDPYSAGYDQHVMTQPTVAPGNVAVHVTQQPTALPPSYPGAPPPNTVIMMQSPPVNYQSFVSHIVLSCFVFWCCGILFGVVAFILAIVAQDRSQAGDQEGARGLGRASLGVSIAGIVVGIVAMILIAVLVAQATKEAIHDINDNLNSNDWNN